MTTIVFDIGGTHMRVARASGDSLLNILKIPTPAKSDEGLSALKSAIRQLSEGKEIEAVAGGIAGVIGRNGEVIKSPNLPGWNGCNLKEELGNMSEKVLVENDADMAGLAEAVLGAGRGRPVVAYIGIGTGVGGSRIVGGRVDLGVYGLEPGHHIINCGGEVTLEDAVSGRALEEKYGKLPKELAHADYKNLVSILATGIHNIILLWSPAVIVLGGSLINREEGFNVEDITEEVRRIPLVFPEAPEILKSEFGDEAGLRGALIVSKTGHPSSVGRASHS